MKAIICTNCGASRWKEDGEYRICLYCGTKFQKALGDSVRHTNPIIQTSVARHVDSVIALNDDIERLLQKCRNEPKNARKYANLILDIDPTNLEALKYFR